MLLDRIELADIHEPRRLARAVHAMLGSVNGPVPVVQISRALDVAKVRLEQFDGFEGMLLTDVRRRTGVILANTGKGRRRARFTVAHELGHFLMERHHLSDERGFRCFSSDLRETREGKRHLRQESEANRFAIELLAPPALFDPYLSAEPDLRDALRLRDHLDTSLEACVRRLIERRDEVLAAIWSHQGRVRYVARGAGFPYIPLNTNDGLPLTTRAFQVIANARPGFTEFAEAHSQAWTGRPDLDFFEQTRLTRDGHAVTLLWADLPDEDEDDGPPELGMPRFR